jgi:hypothetical protein
MEAKYETNQIHSFVLRIWRFRTSERSAYFGSVQYKDHAIALAMNVGENTEET